MIFIDLFNRMLNFGYVKNRRGICATVFLWKKGFQAKGFGLIAVNKWLFNAFMEYYPGTKTVPAILNLALSMNRFASCRNWSVR